MAYNSKVFDQFETLPKEQQQATIASFSPQELDQFERDYQSYNLGKGANNALKVNSRQGSVTQPTKPSNSQILQSTGKAVGQEAVKEGIKQGATKALSSGASEGGFFSATAPEAAANAGWSGASAGAGGIASNAASMGAGPLAGIAAGTYLAGKSAYDMLKGKPEDKSAQGRFGRGQLAVSTGGLSEVGRLFGFGGGKSGKQEIAERIQKLQEQGIEVPKSLMDDYNSYGLSHDELIARAEKDGGNVAFARSRDEKDLTPEDTWGGLMWFETKGNDYLKNTTENQRREMNQRALDEGLIDEAKGQLNFNDKERAAQIYDEVLKDTPAVMPGQVKDGEPYSMQVPGAREDGKTQEKRRPKPKLNDIPVPQQPAPQAPQPTLRTPKDYAQAYLDVYNANANMSGANPYLRRY